MIRSLTRAALVALMLTAAPVATAQNGERFFVAISDTNTPDPQGDVVDVAAATGQFTYFLEAVEQTGYTETLRGEGPFTIFAPTDEAFRAMNARERTRLLAPENRDELCQGMTKRLNAGMSGGLCQSATNAGPAVRPAI